MNNEKINAGNGSAVIKHLNQSYEGLWSFKIIEHQFRDSEIIVLGELSAGTVSRQQFGENRITTDSSTGEASSLGDDLNKAALDALINCARTLNPETATVKPTQVESSSSRKETPPVETAAPGDGTKKLTNRQLAAIYGLGKAQGLGQGDIINLAKERFGKSPMELNRSEASQIIQELTSKNEKE